MIRVTAACLAAMLMCSGCIELMMLGCNDDNDDCSFATTSTPPPPLAPAPVDMAR